MLTTLIRRELLDNLMTFRFAAALFITLLLVTANTAVLLNDYERRLASYNAAVKTHRQEVETETYSIYWLHVDMPPNPLSIFNVGLEKRLGNSVQIHHSGVPTLWDATMHGSDNPFLNLFSSIDIVFIFEVILSLMALIFAYDAIAGERERGTLRLVLTHPVRRGYILFAKYISAMACLLIPLLISLLLAMLLLTSHRSLALSADDFLRIGGIVLTSLAYLSVFYLIGLLISTAVRRMNTSLMLSMFIWGFLVLAYPNLMRATLDPMPNLRAHLTSTANQIRQLWEEFEIERKAYLTKARIAEDNPVRNLKHGKGMSIDSFFFVDSSTLGSFHHQRSAIQEIPTESEPRVPQVQAYYNFLEPLVISTATRAWLLRKQALETIFVQPANIDRTWLKLSPVGIYDEATQAWAGTDLEGIRAFFASAQQYRQTVIDYFYAKKAFSSRKWFASDKGVVDWSTLPQFDFARSDVWTHAKRAAPDVLLLLMCNLALFMAIVLIFIRSEV